MSAIQVEVVPHSQGVESMNSSVDRMERQHKKAKQEPSVLNSVMRGLAIFAAAGTLLNVSLEVAENFQHRE